MTDANQNELQENYQGTSVATSLIAGSAAALIADITLFPIDTIKTRLQSSTGFLKAGGFRGVYKGIASAALGSAPGGASFFLAYEFSKNQFHPYIESPLTRNVMCACMAEVTSISVRIPFEVIKQNAQAVPAFNSRTAFLHVVRAEGVAGLYRGYFSTIFRDLPFSVIQMPLWEALKSEVSKRNNGHVSALHSGLCGSISAGVAAVCTTPVDVVKTRIILAQGTSCGSVNPFKILHEVAVKEGAKGLFAGVVPRAMLITTGGFVFLGIYDFVKIFLQS